jgi:hypothetical protein
METSRIGNVRSRVPINGISALTKLFSAGKMQKIISNLLTVKLIMGLVLVTMIGSIDVAPALGKDDRGRGNGRYEQRRGYDRDRHVQRVYRPYGYRERVYYPPPVIYAPPPQPGISIWFPPIVIHP